MRVPLYPLRFTPVYEQRGTTRGLFADFLAATPDRQVVPEGSTACWELVDSPGAASVIANGPLAGKPFADVLRQAPREIVGRRHPHGKPFPVCVRLAEIGESEPLAVHPETPVRVGDETYLPNHRFWLSLASTDAAQITVGIDQSTTRVDFMQALGTPELQGFLQCYAPLPHDAFFAPSGRVFSIGEGNLVWELRQHASPALPVSNWGEGDPPPEELNDAGLKAIYFQDRQVRRISRDASAIQHTRKVPLLRHCPSFAVEEIRLYDHLYDNTTGATFHLLSVTEGTIRLESGGSAPETVHAGGLILIPAALGNYRLYAESGPARLLRVLQQAI
jgi:mannose-6-phosphate isomerase